MYKNYQQFSDPLKAIRIKGFGENFVRNFSRPKLLDSNEVIYLRPVDFFMVQF